MKVRDAAELLGAQILAEGAMERNISMGLVCDVLSRAMAGGKSGMAFITVQANMNALAVAAMTDAACLIFPAGYRPEEVVVERAQMEKMPLLAAELPAFEIAGRLHAAGLRGEEQSTNDAHL